MTKNLNVDVVIALGSDEERERLTSSSSTTKLISCSAVAAANNWRPGDSKTSSRSRHGLHRRGDHVRFYCEDSWAPDADYNTVAGGRYTLASLCSNLWSRWDQTAKQNPKLQQTVQIHNFSAILNQIAAYLKPCMMQQSSNNKSTPKRKQNQPHEKNTKFPTNILETDPIHCNKHTRTHTHLQVQTFLPTARKWWLSCQLQLHKRRRPNSSSSSSSSSSSTPRLILQHDWSSPLLLLLLLQLKLLFHQNTHVTTREREL